MTAIALLVYLATLAPGLTFEHSGTDSGDLVTAAWTLGVPHPTGYPTYTLLAWLFSRLPFGTVAYRINLLSAVCAAATVGLLFNVTRRLMPATERSPVIAGAAALTLAFSSLFWSQAVISEVYALLACFAALMLWLLVRWQQGGSEGFLWLAGLVLGIGLGNHLTLAAAGPAALVLLWPDRRRWLRVRACLPTAAFLVAGLGIYAYLPLAAAHHPPVNWGNPQTWQGLRWVVTAKQYQAFAFGLDPSQVLGRLGAWSVLFGEQFGWWGLAVTLAGIAWWWRRARRFVLFALTWILPLSLYALLYDTGDSHVYLLPVLLLLALFWGEGARYLLHVVQRLRPEGRRLLLVIIALLPFGSMAMHWRVVDLSKDYAVHNYIHQALESMAADSLVIVRGDRPTFALWYGIYVEDIYTDGRRADVAVVNAPMLAFIWYREHVRQLYPHLLVREPASGGEVTTDDLFRDLVINNFSPRPIYATDPKEEWKAWFDFVEEGDAPIYRIQPKTRWGPEG